MAVSITQEPDALSLAKNQILYRAQTDAYITNAGVPFTTSLYLDVTPPANGETFTITVLGIFFTYTFTDTPDPASCFDIDRAGGVGADMQANLYAQLKKNFYLERYYNVNNGFGIQAKEPGSIYNLTFGGTASLVYVPTASTPEVNRSDYAMAWDLFMGGDSASEPDEFIVGQFLKPDANQQVFPDMAELIEKQLSPDLPAYATDVIAYNQNSLRKFMIRFGDFYDGKVHCYQRATVMRAILAGIALERWPFANFANEYGAGISGQKFLSNLPREVLVDRATQSFLCVLVLAEYDVLVNITWDDGTTSSNVLLYSVAGNAKSMAIIPVGFDVHDLISLMPGTAEYAVSYEIFVQQDGAESEHFKFELDNHFKLNPRRFIFHNSLNGWDTVWCTGDQARSLANTGEEFSIPTPRAFKSDAVESLVIPSNSISEDPDQTRILQLNTGYRSKVYIQALARELPLSRRILLDTGSKWLEIRLDRGSIKEIDNDSDELWSLSFSYTYGFIDKAF